MTSGLKPLKVLEACLYSNDLPAAEEFYSRVLGLEVYLPATEREVFFRCGDCMVLIFDPRKTRLADSSVSGAPDGIPTHGAVGVGHLAFAVSPDELEAWRTRLNRHSVEIDSEVRWPNGARSLYFQDPAGNCLELTVASLWQHSAGEMPLRERVQEGS